MGGRQNEILRGQVFIIDEKCLANVIITLKNREYKYEFKKAIKKF